MIFDKIFVSGLALLSVLAVMFVAVTCHHHHHHQYYEGYYVIETNVPHFCYKKIFSNNPDNPFHLTMDDNSNSGSDESTSVDSNENTGAKMNVQ